MKGLKRLVLVFGLGCVAQVVLAASPTNSTVLDGKDYICPGDPIDDGFVIESKIQNEGLSETCINGEVFQIRDSATLSVLYMCPGSPVPAGWIISSVVASHIVGATCPGGQSYRIENSDGQSLMYMCPGSPLPSGWIISSLIPSINVGRNCPGGNSYKIVNSAPPPPPPPPAIPKAATILPIIENSNGHTVQWVPADDYPDYRMRFALEQSINGGKWKQVYKGWDNLSWTAVNPSPATYSYRVMRITQYADGQYSGVVSISEGGL